MIGAADLARFCDTTMSIAGGDVRAQMEAWGVDHDEFFEFVTAWSNAYGIPRGVDPRDALTCLFIGFELGYRSCAEGGAMGVGDMPDVVPDFGICKAKSCDQRAIPGQDWCEDHIG